MKFAFYIGVSCGDKSTGKMFVTCLKVAFWLLFGEVGGPGRNLGHGQNNPVCHLASGPPPGLQLVQIRPVDILVDPPPGSTRIAGLAKLMEIFFSDQCEPPPRWEGVQLLAFSSIQQNVPERKAPPRASVEGPNLQMGEPMFATACGDTSTSAPG